MTPKIPEKPSCWPGTKEEWEEHRKEGDVAVQQYFQKIFPLPAKPTIDKSLYHSQRKSSREIVPPQKITFVGTPFDTRNTVCLTIDGKFQHMDPIGADDLPIKWERLS